MSLSLLSKVKITDAQVAQPLQQGAADQAQQAATQRAAVALADLAAVAQLRGDAPRALTCLQLALQIAPQHPQAFHNLAALLLATGQLHGAPLDALLARINGNQAPVWAKEYHWMFRLPRFLNIEFTKGKCNLQCRMCVGTNRPEYPNRLSATSLTELEKMLDAAPTVDGITLSAADSDPLLHPQMEEVLQLLQRRGLTADLFTNGHPLGARLARTVVATQTLKWLNFSLDAATTETYRRIRGDDLNRVLDNIRRLQAIKAELGKPLPSVALAFVVMADNVEELPAFVHLARELGALRIFVEDLTGLDHVRPENRPFQENPRWEEAVRQAIGASKETGVPLDLPQQMDALRRATDAQVGAKTLGAAPIPYCSWVPGVWVDQDGALSPCCMVHEAADMGNIKDGPLSENARYQHVKTLLMQGKVFPRCLEQRMCIYVQQRLAQGSPPPVMTQAELGPLWREPPSHQRDAVVSLTRDGQPVGDDLCIKNGTGPIN